MLSLLSLSLSPQSSCLLHTQRLFPSLCLKVPCITQPSHFTTASFIPRPRWRDLSFSFGSPFFMALSSSLAFVYDDRFDVTIDTRVNKARRKKTYKNENIDEYISNSHTTEIEAFTTKNTFPKRKEDTPLLMICISISYFFYKCQSAMRNEWMLSTVTGFLPWRIRVMRVSISRKGAVLQGQVQRWRARGDIFQPGFVSARYPA